MICCGRCCPIIGQLVIFGSVHDRTPAFDMTAGADVVWFPVSSLSPTGATRKTHPLTSSSLSARLIACCRDRTRKVVDKLNNTCLPPSVFAPSHQLPSIPPSYTGSHQSAMKPTTGEPFGLAAGTVHYCLDIR